MSYPAWVRKHRKKNTEIRLIEGKYYLYERTSTWSPEKKRAKKITGKYLGSIHPEHGLIPQGMSRRGPVPKGKTSLKEDVKQAGFMDFFSKTEDSRSERNRLHLACDIIFIAFAAILCGAEGWSDIENYGKAKINLIKKFCTLKNGIPSDDTFRRFFRVLDPKKFKEIFSQWIAQIIQNTSGHIAIDGKCLKGSCDENGNMIHIVSAFCTENNIVLGQDKVDEKSNEITAIPKLLEAIDIQGTIITIDAMGCQFKIADQIVEGKGDYILSLKENQGNLAKGVSNYFADKILIKNCKTGSQHNKGHGRTETRECVISEDIKWLHELNPKWTTIKTIILIKAKREFSEKSKEGRKRKGEPEFEHRYYVSSLRNKKPEMFSSNIRAHWGIENSLHWILDMTFNEDYSRIREKNAPEIAAIIRHFALNHIQMHKPENQSVKAYRKICAWNDDEMEKMITKIYFS